MLAIAEQFAASDTGRQRRANEDAMFVRAPLFVVADGMGGAQAGEVASGVAVDEFREASTSEIAADPETALAATASAANARIHDLAEQNPDQAGMGTTLTAAYVGEENVAIAHVGDSRAYCLRDGELMKLTDDHSLVDELMREGRLTPEEAQEHPQRSVITRALGPYSDVEIDTRSFHGRDGDLLLLCSDGLTSMLDESVIHSILRGHGTLPELGRRLIAAANEAGGRDNITVLLVRLRELDARLAVEGPTSEVTSEMAAPVITAGAADAARPPKRLQPRQPRSAEARAGRRRRRVRSAAIVAGGLAVAVLIAGYLAIQSIYFVGTNDQGLVTIYQGLPYRLPADIPLFSRVYVSGVPYVALGPQSRAAVDNQHGRSENNAREFVRSLELGRSE
jgi:protein phosphatase